MSRPHPAAATETMPSWLVPSTLFVGTLLTYAITAAYRLVSLDVESAYRASWRLSQTGAPWIEGLSIPSLDDNASRSTWVIEAANGHTVIGRSPGVVLAGLPGYVLGGDQSFSLAPGALTAAVLAACTVLMVFLALRHLVNDRGALLGALAFGFTTPTWSVAANGIWPHTVTMLGIAGMSWGASTRRWWVVALFGSVVMWGRLHAAVIVAVFGLYVAWRQRDPGVVVRLGLVGAAGLALLCAWSQWMYGTWSPTASYDTTVFEDYATEHGIDLVNQLSMWVAFDRGILIWTPAILVLLPALIRSWPSQPDWCRGLLWGGLVYTVLQAYLNQFKGGEGFYGYRLGLEFLACATPALVVSVQHAGSTARRLLGPVLGLQLVAFFFGSTADYFVPGGTGWNDNAFLLALRTNVGAVTPMLIIACVGGWVLQPRVERLLRDGPERGTTETQMVAEGSGRVR